MRRFGFVDVRGLWEDREGSDGTPMASRFTPPKGAQGPRATIHLLLRRNRTNGCSDPHGKRQGGEGDDIWLRNDVGDLRSHGEVRIMPDVAGIGRWSFYGDLDPDSTSSRPPSPSLAHRSSG